MNRFEISLVRANPVLEVSLSPHMLEVEPLITELTGREVSIEVDGGDLHVLGVEVFLGPDVEDVGACRAESRKLVIPCDIGISRICVSEGADKGKLVRCDDIFLN